MRWKIAVILTCGVLLWVILRSDGVEQELEKEISRVAALASVEKTPEVFESRLLAEDISKNIAEEVLVDYNSPEYSFNRKISRKELKNAASALLMRLHKSEVVFSRFRLVDSGDDSATVSFFLIAEWQTDDSSERHRAAEEVSMEFKLVDGEWKVSAVMTEERQVL